MNLSEAAPADWDAQIAFPLQSKGFAEASRALGYRPLFADEAGGRALVLVRQVPMPLVSAWTARAKVYAHGSDPAFLPALCGELRRRGIAHVRLGDAVWGMAGAAPETWPGLRRVASHLFVHDLTVGEAELLSRTRRMIRRHLRKWSDDVTVTAVRSKTDLRDYLALAAETGLRMRFRDVAAVYPPAYLATIFRQMVPRGQAIMFLARAGGAPLAAATFLLGRERFAQIHGCSTRDRALTPKQGPTFLFWHAMRYACVNGYKSFDMGAVTPTDDPGHPHYSVYEYKKLWGGRLEQQHSAELVVSPWKHRFQETALAPLWDRLHPFYLRVFSERRRARTAAPALFELSGQEQHP